MISRKLTASIASAIAITFAPPALSSVMPQDLPLERLLEQVGSNPELSVEQERTNHAKLVYRLLDCKNYRACSSQGTVT